MAAQIRRDLGCDVEMARAPYGEFQVLVDGGAVVDAASLGRFAVLPSARSIVELVKARLGPA